MQKLSSLLEQDDGQTMTEYATTLSVITLSASQPSSCSRPRAPARSRGSPATSPDRGILGAAEITDIA
jgi:hypothetical protein